MLGGPSLLFRVRGESEKADRDCRLDALVWCWLSVDCYKMTSPGRSWDQVGRRGHSVRQCSSNAMSSEVMSLLQLYNEKNVYTSVHVKRRPVCFIAKLRGLFNYVLIYKPLSTLLIKKHSGHQISEATHAAWRMR